jgi:short-subunit dehydrogenase
MAALGRNRPCVSVGKRGPHEQPLRRLVAFTNKLAAIVGGGSGIGKVVAMAAARGGATVILSSRTRDKLQTAARDVSETEIAPVDMTDAASVEAWKAALPELDHLVISASSAAHGRCRKA